MKPHKIFWISVICIIYLLLIFISIDFLIFPLIVILVLYCFLNFIVLMDTDADFDGLNQITIVYWIRKAISLFLNFCTKQIIKFNNWFDKKINNIKINK